MVFNSDIFLFGFLPIVFFLFWWTSSKESRYILLALGGYVFYGWWNWRYCLLLLLSSEVSFFAGLGIARSEDPRRRKAIMLAAIVFDLTVLGFFKYYNFLADTVNRLAAQGSLPILDIVLPVGISFYTFHTISYVIDVHARRVRATANHWEYLTYVNLFSQLVAGPIVRFRQIEKDLEEIDGPPREEWIARGFGFFLVGLAKKVLIADHLARFVDPSVGNLLSLSTLDAWIVAVGYAMQLYFDFSGYSDMAVGLGYFFALRIPQNFNAPYRAAGIGDFWRRWHISLSSWLRDYLYIALGGNRDGPRRTYRNLILTMLLGGLWHGANWTFVAWGAYHGVLLAAERGAHRFLVRVPKLLYQGLTFILVVLGWVLFRSPTFSMAILWLDRLFTPHGLSLSTRESSLAWLGLACAMVAFIPETWDIRFPATRRWAVGYAAVFLVIYAFMNGTESVFLYFQF